MPGPYVEVIDLNGALPPNMLIAAAQAVGYDTGWLPALGWSERFMAQLDMGGASASVTLDGSNDGITSAGQIGIFTLDQAGSQMITNSIKSPYNYIRMSVVSATGTVTLGRGA